MNYEVGKVVYLLHPGKNAVLPGRILEQVTKKTISGEEQHFYVEIPGSKNLLNLSDFDGIVFNDPEAIKDHLFSNLKVNIENLVANCVNQAEDLWGKQTLVNKTPKKRSRRRTKKELEEKTEEKIVLVDLGDGTIAKLKE
jgi:hypothetical protein